MLPRHAKMLGIFSMLFALLTLASSYLFVAFHFHHVWSLFCNVALLCKRVLVLCTIRNADAFRIVFAFISPAICFGYNSVDDGSYLLRDTQMTEDTFRNWRDCGYATGVMLFLVTYLLPVVAWYSAIDGTSIATTPPPQTDSVARLGFPYTGVMCVYLGNTAYAIAFLAWYKIFILGSNRGGNI